MQQNIELTPLHNFGFIYLAFAHQTDGILTILETREIWRNAQKWAQKNRTQAEFAQVMDETMDWYRSKMHQENILETVLEVAATIGEYDWFDRKKRLAGLVDLKKIAWADHEFLENEHEWINRIAHLWEIDKRTLRRIFKKVINK